MFRALLCRGWAVSSDAGKGGGPQAKHEWTEGMRHLAENELFVLSAFIAFQ